MKYFGLRMELRTNLRALPHTAHQEGTKHLRERVVDIIIGIIGVLLTTLGLFTFRSLCLAMITDTTSITITPTHISIYVTAGLLITALLAIGVTLITTATTHLKTTSNNHHSTRRDTK